MRNIVTILFAAILLTSCVSMKKEYTSEYGKLKWWQAKPYAIGDGLPDGDDSYSQGFRDGMNTALGIIGSGMMRTHGFSFDANRGIEDPDYYRGYKIGFNYGTFYSDWDPL